MVVSHLYLPPLPDGLSAYFAVSSNQALGVPQIGDLVGSSKWSRSSFSQLHSIDKPTVKAAGPPLQVDVLDTTDESVIVLCAFLRRASPEMHTITIISRNSAC